jgi:TolB-like protein
LGGARVASALSEVLARRGVQVIDRPDGGAHLIVAVWGSNRSAGSWNGIPLEQVSLRYALLDARAQRRIGAGVDAMSFADPTVESARAGALRRAADSAARRIITNMRQLPAPEPLPEAAPRAQVAQLSIAALPFYNATRRPELSGWCETLSAIAAQELTACGRFRVVERARLGEVLKEDDLASALGANPTDVSEMGKRLGVDLLLVGELAVRPDAQLSLTARFVQSSDGQIRQSIIATAPAARTNDLELQLRRQLPQQTEDWILRELEQLRQAPEAWPADGR